MNAKYTFINKKNIIYLGYIIYDYTQLRKYFKKNTLTLHKSSKELKSENTLKNTLFQLSLITVINLN